MPEWIANVYRQRIFSMCIADVGELRRNGIKRFIPGDFLPAIGGFFLPGGVSARYLHRYS